MFKQKNGKNINMGRIKKIVGGQQRVQEETHKIINFFLKIKKKNSPSDLTNGRHVYPTCTHLEKQGENRPPKH